MDSTPNKSENLLILIVEDDVVAARVFGQHLKKAGYSVLWAADGPSGVQKALEANPHGVLLDIMLPGLSGVEVLRQIRAKKPQLPVLVYTNGFVPLLTDDVVKAGATHVFNKISLTRQQLVGAFDKHLRYNRAA